MRSIPLQNDTANKLTDEELIAALRKQVSAWFSNIHLLEFEELLRRYEKLLTEKAKR